MQSKRTLPIFAVFTLFLILLSGCGNSSLAEKGVPDRTAELVILDYLDEQELQQDDYNSYSFRITHNFDKKSNSDAAIIDLQIEYNYASENLQIPVWYSYDRASALWSLNRKGNWSDSVMTYHEDKMIGCWTIDFEGGIYDNYTIDIQSVNGNMVTLNYHIYEILGNTSDSILSLDGSGTFPIVNEGMDIVFDLPDGFYSYDYSSGNKYRVNTSSFHVRVSPQEGCCCERRFGIIFNHRPYIEFSKQTNS